MSELSTALDFIQEHQHFILTTHEGTDADGFGAEIALATTIKSLGKTARIVNAALPPSGLRFMDGEGIAESFDPKGEALRGEFALILLDTADPYRIGSFGESLAQAALAVLIVDHHETPGAPGLSGYIDTSASSTCEMVYRIMVGLGQPPRGKVATALFAGIVYDTGSFSYAHTEASTFEAGLELVKGGARPYDVHQALFESSSIGALLLQKRVLGSLELAFGERIAIQHMKEKDILESGAAWEDADPLVNIPLRATSVEVSVLFKEGGEGECRCSLRSKGTINVARLAQAFGGGGHARAAGFKLSRGIEETKTRLLGILGAEIASASEQRPMGAHTTEHSETS